MNCLYLSILENYVHEIYTINTYKIASLFSACCYESQYDLCAFCTELIWLISTSTTMSLFTPGINMRSVSGYVSMTFVHLHLRLKNSLFFLAHLLTVLNMQIREAELVERAKVLYGPLFTCCFQSFSHFPWPSPLDGVLTLHECVLKPSQ